MSGAAENYFLRDSVPLTFIRIRLGQVVNGLTVSVVVKNARTGATLLASTNVPETAAGNGIYTYNWSHNLKDETECAAFYTVSGNTYCDVFTIGDNAAISRAI